MATVETKNKNGTHDLIEYSGCRFTFADFIFIAFGQVLWILYTSDIRCDLLIRTFTFIYLWNNRTLPGFFFLILLYFLLVFIISFQYNTEIKHWKLKSSNKQTVNNNNKLCDLSLFSVKMKNWNKIDFNFHCKVIKYGGKTPRNIKLSIKYFLFQFSLYFYKFIINKTFLHYEYLFSSILLLWFISYATYCFLPPQK